MAEIMFKVTVIWRGNKFIVGMNTDASVKDLGDELQKLTDIKADTMRLIVPRFSNKSSKLLFPFSDEHSQLSLQEASIMEVSFSTLSLSLSLFFKHPKLKLKKYIYEIDKKNFKPNSLPSMNLKLNRVEVFLA